ncbi:MAG: hypothetical protein M5T61_18890 [Acidimicrobiia bacterium]|nr:hypothetical protein [Acidimicrobiia bacterium]
MRAGGKARSAWGFSQTRRRAALTGHQGAPALTAAGVLPPLRGQHRPRPPDLRPARPSSPVASPGPTRIRHLVTLVAAGMEPGVYTADEAAERAAIVASRSTRDAAA